MRATTSVVFCAIDNLILPTGKALSGFAQFLDSLAEASVSCIWVTARTRLQLDATIRKFGHAEPFIAEGGSGVYLHAIAATQRGRPANRPGHPAPKSGSYRNRDWREYARRFEPKPS